MENLGAQVLAGVALRTIRGLLGPHAELYRDFYCANTCRLISQDRPTCIMDGAFMVPVACGSFSEEQSSQGLDRE